MNNLILIIFMSSIVFSHYVDGSARKSNLHLLTTRLNNMRQSLLARQDVLDNNRQKLAYCDVVIACSEAAIKRMERCVRGSTF